MRKYVDEAQLPADYVIEYGVLDGWDYKKWFSGKYVCRKIVEETLTYYTTVGNFYGFVSSNIKYPISFSSIPILRYNARVANGFAIPASDVVTGKSNCRCYALSTASGECYCCWEIEVIGEWKKYQLEQNLI